VFVITIPLSRFSTLWYTLFVFTTVSCACLSPVFFSAKNVAHCPRVLKRVQEKSRVLGGAVKRLSLQIIFFFLAVILPSATFAQAASGPRMVIEEKEFDFNEVREGKIVEHAFKVLNKGDQPLQIRNVRPG
jgi:hypothetical protein